MDRTSQQWHFQEGSDVYGSDGEKLGKVIAVHPGYLVVEKGFFFPTDYYIPTSAVANAEDDKIYLTSTKDAALNQGWEVEPMVADDYDMTRTTGLEAAAGETWVEDTETLRVPVHEEELTATKRERELGQVRIEKDVVTEEQVLEVPVTEERVRIERRVVDRPVSADDTSAFQEGDIEVPIRGEEVELRKQTRVAEEIEIGKEAVQRTEQVSGTVRREEVRIDENVTQDVRTTGTRSRETSDNDQGLR